ncbi:MAG: dTDP-4-dehydrorhamnose 3,5-epimerase family protein, partial [Vicinamibacterales bacterium]
MAAPVKYHATQQQTIDGVKVKPLRVVADARGWLMEILRGDDESLFTRFGQVYVSATYPGVVKAWHYHRKQVDNFACVAGMVKLVLIDTRIGSRTEGTV